ncbi:MAG: DNA-binding MurR/RpiR family transcriptional regulator [Planctomycetota bacterium]|jgi:DNA-binding MurR/RpiR family transcriptional regulator
MLIPDLIAAASDRLTPTERRIAAAVLRDPTLLAFGTVSDLASRVDTSRPSIVRFATKLGFEGYADLQNTVRLGLSDELSRPSQRIRQQVGAAAAPKQVDALTSALAGVFEALSGPKLTSLARPIAQAEQVWIVSGETSRAGAHALHSGLTMVRPGIHLIEEYSSARELSGATPKDVAVVIDFARYRRHAIQTARSLAGLGVPIVAITDSPLSPLASLTEDRCEVTVPAVGPFDSSVPAVAAAELIVSSVASQLHDAAQDQIDQTELLWDQAGTFLE